MPLFSIIVFDCGTNTGISGAGTGGSTRNILPLLGSSFSSYTYTDISSGFFEAAQERFSEYEGRMIFKTFDMERSPASQGFVEGSYDLVLASNVLHATGLPQEMMRNVRKLLKPGGYLITLELTSNDTLRVGLPMGSLPGWWVGAESGRPDGPAFTLPQWDVLLRDSGFGGIETSTPPLHKLYVSTVFASQAVDDRVALLRSPLPSMVELPPTDAAQLVITGGETLAAHRIAERLRVLLAPRFSNVVRVSNFESLDAATLPPSSTVLSLTELDEPLFKTITPGKLGALKTLWSQASTILWVTRGSRAEEPHSFMTVGVGRVMRFEYPNISLQVLDLDRLEHNTPEVLAEELLRLEVLGKWEKESRGDDLLWSVEPEVYLESGTRVIPRLYQMEQANTRYNSSRRTITKEVDPKESSVLFSSGGASYELQHPSPLHRSDRLPTSGPTTTVLVSHFVLQTVSVPFAGSLMLVVGTDEATGKNVLALSHTSESRATVLSDWTVPLDGTDPAKALVSVASNITASAILNSVPSGGTIVVHEPDQWVGSALEAQSKQCSVDLVVTTSVKAPSSNGWRSIQPNLPQRLVKRVLPKSPSAFVDLSQAPGSAAVGQTIRKCLPPSCVTYSSTHFYTTVTELRTGFQTDRVTEMLRSACLLMRAGREQNDSPSPPVSRLQDLSKLSVIEASLTVVNCSDQTVTANIQPIDEGMIFRPDRTYFLVGLAGEVGQSLCQWMVEHGARYIALTSRRPKVHPEFIRSMEAMGATVKALPL